MRKKISIGLGILATAVLAAGCGGNQSKNTTSTEGETQKVLVKTEFAITEEIERSQEFTSNIESYKENNIAPSFPVRIENIYVNIGDRVEQGQLLVRMDPTQYNQAAVQLANLEADFARMKAVFDAGGISRQQIDQTETQLRVQRENINNLKQNIELRSPISGVVTERNYDPGDMYSGAPVLKVMQISTLKVSANLSERFSPMVKIGMKAEIAVDTYPGKVFEGKITQISPAIEMATRTFPIEITIPNPSGELRPGMFARSLVKFGSSSGVTISDLAVQRQPGTSERYVLIVKDGKAVRQLVTTGAQVGNRIEILSGVREGDEIITAGFARLSNGSEVEVVNE